MLFVVIGQSLDITTEKEVVAEIGSNLTIPCLFCNDVKLFRWFLPSLGTANVRHEGYDLEIESVNIANSGQYTVFAVKENGIVYVQIMTVFVASESINKLIII